MASMDTVYDIISLSVGNLSHMPKVMAQRTPHYFRFSPKFWKSVIRRNSDPMLMSFTVQSKAFARGIEIQRPVCYQQSLPMSCYSCRVSTEPAQLPRSAQFWSEYRKLSTVLSALRLGLLPLQSTLGLSEFEIIPPFNPDTLYLRIVINVSVLLLYDVLAQDGDQAAHTESVNAAKELAKLARMMRASGRSTHGPQGAHEIQVPYIMVVCISCPFKRACYAGCFHRSQHLMTIPLVQI